MNKEEITNFDTIRKEKLIENIRQCSSIHNRCDYLLDHNDCDDLIEYIYNLQHQLEEKQKVIDEIDKRCNQEINAATIQYERNKRNDTWQYIIAHKRILEILERGKNDSRGTIRTY